MRGEGKKSVILVQTSTPHLNESRNLHLSLHRVVAQAKSFSFERRAISFRWEGSA